MEKKLPPVRLDFESVSLKKSDVVEIVNILGEPQAVVKIETDSCRFADADEFLAHDEPFRDIHLYQPRFQVSVRMSAWSFSLWAPTADAIALGLATRIERLVATRTVLLSPARLIPAGAFLVVGLGCAALFLLSRFSVVAAAVVAFVVIVAGGATLSHLKTRLRASSIRFRAEKPTPINGRAAAWEVFKLLLAAGLGVLGTLALHK